MPGLVILTFVGTFIASVIYMLNIESHCIAVRNVDRNVGDYEDDMYIKLFDLIAYWRKFVFYVSLPFIIITSLLPSGNTYHLMVGAYFTQQTIQHPETQEIFTKVKSIVFKEIR